MPPRYGAKADVGADTPAFRQPRALAGFQDTGMIRTPVSPVRNTVPPSGAISM